jgi:hypothetical protein
VSLHDARARACAAGIARAVGASVGFQAMGQGDADHDRLYLLGSNCQARILVLTADAVCCRCWAAGGCELGRVDVAGWVWMGSGLDWLRDLFCRRQCGVSPRAHRWAVDSSTCVGQIAACSDGNIVLLGWQLFLDCGKLHVRIQKKMVDFSRSFVPLPSGYLLGICFDFTNIGMIKG